ncbi:MAG: KTSC domain-containing protein [Acidobacteriaceae bacterium]|jgi:hypothetical protein
MQLTPVTSSRFAAIGFDEDAFQLFVQYHPTEKEPKGTVWRYDNVSPELFDDFRNADSIGKFFGMRIQGNPEHTATKIKLDGTDEAQEPIEEAAPPEVAFENPEDAIATAMVVANQAKQLQISTPDAYELAGRELVTLAREMARRKAFFQPMKEAAFKTHREICAREAEALKPLQEAERMLTAGITSYRAAEERRRREEQERIDKAQRERAQADADQRAVEIAEEKARSHEARGNQEAAAQVRANPVPVAPAYVPPAVLQKDVPKVEGLSFTDNWDFEIEDETQVPLSHDYYTLDERKIRAKVKLMKQHCKIPGVRVFPVERARKRASA